MNQTKIKFLGEKGQTAVEYMMLIVVSATICLAFKKKVDEFLVGNPNSVLSKQLNNLNRGFESGGNGRFESFALHK